MLGWMALAVAVSLPVLCLLCFPTVLLRPLPDSQKNARTKTNVLLLVAHPDDESMFFGPTLLSLSKLGGYSIRVICLSTGNADGLGARRKLEMVAACSVLKVPEDNVEVLDHPALQDGFGCHWDQPLILKLLQQAVTTHNIHVILTFDSYGVSGHPNHRSVSAGVRAFLLEEERRLHHKNGPKGETVQGWELVSTNIMRKFCGPLEMFVSVLTWVHSDQREMHCFLNPSPITSIMAMSRHQSQWVWYRRLFVLFARYTYVNTLKQIRT
ncbi:hypothetical protein BDL97_02G132300 [Sphagnum fallax]|nr:hypothetical protein BDL97_02G132300 [Sphagnum fallax]